MKKCIIVLGMHRSGTSVLSNLVSLMGCHIGRTDTMPKRADNPKGFFENYKIYKFNQNLLEENNVSWDEYSFTVKDIHKNQFRNYVEQAKVIIQEEFNYVNLFFIKDPRMCLLFPIWEAALEELNIETKCILSYRSILEVSLSLEKRNQFSLVKSMMIWSHYFFQSELNSRSKERILIRFNQDYENIEALLKTLSQFIGVDLDAEIKKTAKETYSKKLVHHSIKEQNLSDDIPSYLKSLIKLISESRFTDFKELDTLRKDFNNSIKYYLHDYTNLMNQNLKLNKQLIKNESDYKQDKLDGNHKNKILSQNLKELSASNINLNNSVKDLTDSKNLLEAEKDNLAQIILSLEDETNQLEHKIKNLQDSNKRASEDVRNKSDEISELNQHKTKLEEKTSSLTQIIKKHEEKKKELEHLLRNQTDENNQLTITAKAYKAEILSLKKKNKKAKKKNKQLIRSHKKLTTEISSFKKELKNHKHTQENLENLLSNEKYKNKQITDKHKTSNTENLSLKKAINNYQIELEINKQKLQVAEKKQTSQESLLQKQQQQLSNSLNRLEDNKQQFIKRISELKKRLKIGDSAFNKVLSNKPFTRKISKNLSQPSKIEFLFKTAVLNEEKKRFFYDRTIIIQSELFSPFYYLTRYHDVWQSEMDPLSHFCLYGWRESRDPNPSFNTSKYIQRYPDVKKSGLNPLVHYILHGQKENRNTGYTNAMGEYHIQAISQAKSQPISNTRPLKQSQPQKTQTPNNKTEQDKDSKLKTSLLKTETITKTISKQIAPAVTPLKNEGHINGINNGAIEGWLTSKNKHSTPVVKLNGMPCQSTVENPSSENANNKTFYKSPLLSSINQASIELLTLSEKGITSLSNKNISSHWNTIDKYSDLNKALELSKQAGAVAITVWEGAHNPIGRAKVLYDIIASKRPVILFAYIFGDYGEHLWSPLQNADINIVLIPYEDRYNYQSIIKNYGIEFDTIWICKYRLHSFELASMLAHSETACILDIDDNEDAFLDTKASKLKPYGIFSKNKANYYQKRLITKSVASQSIQALYGGSIVRHARKEYSGKINKRFDKNNLTAVFIGTIRPHKNIDSLVKAIASFNKDSSNKVTLAIGGDFNPPTMRKTLKTADTLILDSVSSDDLYETLIQYDVIITGFPDLNNENKSINKLQISSKIGDGLAIGRPVLTPLSASVEDLKNIPGLYLFTQDNFNEKLKQALEYKRTIKLPADFSIDSSYTTFKKLEQQAKSQSSAKHVFKFDPFFNYKRPTSPLQKNIVLIWKQYDSGIYGRRIDHIARYYKQNNPNCKITIIEVISDKDLTNLMNTKSQFDNFSIVLNDVLKQKQCEYTLDGVEYKLISHSNNSGWNSFNDKFKCFLDSQRIYPSNTVMILFPLHTIFNQISPIIKEYKTIVDLVDNQIKWITTPEKRIVGLKQYYELINMADEVVSNSPENLQYFRKLNFLANKNTKVIKNWYTTPQNCNFTRKLVDGEINLVYSGNLNDRIDWQLLHKVCILLEKHNGFLHIIGTSVRSSESMVELLQKSNCIYHGVINEIQLLRVLQHTNFTVVPHVEDSISKFMDPIKLKMYKKLGIKSLSSKLPGLPLDDPMIIVADSADDFLVKLEKMITKLSENSDCSYSKDKSDKIGDQYNDIIDRLFSLS